MSDTKPQHKPTTSGIPAPDPLPSDRSMEEIIASISRMIGEDSRPADWARPNSPAPNTPVLELTEAIAADGSVRRLTPVSGTPAAAGVAPAAATKRIEPEPPAAMGATGETPEPPRERLLSAATSEAVATAFARLGAVPRERRPGADLPIGNASRTLEEIVRDSLRPLLQGWLDEHLPGIVERLVREAIGRVVAEAELR